MGLGPVALESSRPEESTIAGGVDQKRRRVDAWSKIRGGAWEESEGACVGVSASDRRRWIRLVERILQMWSLIKNDDRMTSNEPISLSALIFSL